MYKKEKIKISYSHYSLYKECGHRYLLESILNVQESIPTINSCFGDAIHSVLQKSFEHEFNEEERIKEFEFIFRQKCFNKLKGLPDYNNVEEFLEQGKEILKLIPTEKLSKKYIYIGAEYTINEKLYKNYCFVGFIDLILKNKKTKKYIIIDWKTSTYEWDIENKKEDKVLLTQMKFYKYFYSKQKGIPLEEIECKYVILSRFKEKNNHNAGFGKLQNVEIETDEKELEECLEDLAKVTRDIFIRKVFNKAKLSNNKKSCIYCPFKDNINLCNNKKEDFDNFIKRINEGSPSSS
jgi:hypothetical protein